MTRPMRALVTGGAGFIGYALVRALAARPRTEILVLDKLTYAANPAAVEDFRRRPALRFVEGDVADRALLARLFAEWRPDAVFHLAAESHVDRSIERPEAFVETNVLGTAALLDAALAHWQALPAAERAAFRLLQVSTDEVYGSLAAGAPGFTEETPFRPNSPYAASKAAGDHLARAWQRTYGLPVLVSHSSNNYGAWQFPEKLIPLAIAKALAGQPLPLYGDGRQVRDWLYVEDHAAALLAILERGRPGETYNVGGGAELPNLDLVERLCLLLDVRRPRADRRPHADGIVFVPDRPGHDRRYAIDARKIERELGWRPAETFASGLRKTVGWYLDNLDWCHRVQDGSYQRQRLGALQGPQP